MGGVYDQQAISELREFFERRIEYLDAMSSKLLVVKPGVVEVAPGKIELSVFSEFFRLLAGAVLTEFKLVCYVLEHLEVSAQYHSGENEHILSELNDLVGDLSRGNLSHTVLNTHLDKLAKMQEVFSQATSDLKKLWQTAVKAREDQELEDSLSMKRLQ